MHSAEGRAQQAALCRHGVARRQVRIVDPDGLELPRGEVGEVIVKSPGVMLGRWNNPDEAAQALTAPAPSPAHNARGGAARRVAGFRPPAPRGGQPETNVPIDSLRDTEGP